MITSKYVKSNSEVFGGTYCINGTRVPVKSVIYLYKELKVPPKDIALKYYVQIKLEQIIGAIQWYEENTKKYGQVAL